MQGSTFLCTRIRSFSTRSAVIRIDYFVDHFLVPRTSGVQLSCISISTFKKRSVSLLMHISLYPVFLQVVAPRGPLPLESFLAFKRFSDRIRSVMRVEIRHRIFILFSFPHFTK